MLSNLLLRFRFLSLFCVAALSAATIQANEIPTRFFDSAAREMLAQLQAGEGWIVVSQRAPIQLIEGAAAVDCVKYQVVTNHRSGTTSNDQFVLELEYSAETPWIMVELGLPTSSGTSLAAARLANQAVEKLDLAIGGLATPVDAEAAPEVRALGQKLLGVLRSQRAAMVDVIQKDIQALRLAP